MSWNAGRVASTKPADAGARAPPADVGGDDRLAGGVAVSPVAARRLGRTTSGRTAGGRTAMPNRVGIPTPARFRNQLR
jgi:hypothetical protein